MRAHRFLCLLLVALLIMPSRVTAAEVRVAVAANFTDPARELAALFGKATGHEAVLSFGATGQLFAQITQGAPFEVLLAADKATPEKAVAGGHAVEGTAFTYAVGRLVLFSRSKDLAAGEAVLRSAGFDKLAIANPALAPYGAAAVEVMRRLGVWDALQPKVVQGQSIAQALQFVETGNAELGFVALAQVAAVAGGSRWIVPEELHAPILQDAVLLESGRTSAAARAFLDFLKSREARAVIGRFGYGNAD